MSLSLAGPCAMEFRRGSEQRALFLPPRSLLVMADEARYAWHHYIPHRRSDPLDGQAVPRAASRVSFTFRKVRHASAVQCNASCNRSQSAAGAREPEWGGISDGVLGVSVVFPLRHDRDKALHTLRGHLRRRNTLHFFVG